MTRGVRWWPGLAVIAVVLVAGLLMLRVRDDATPPLVVPDELSPLAREGREAYDRHCAECHGRHAAGGRNGPPLVHVVYRPGHHADAAFLLAVQRGVRAHHWRLGDMPPQPEVPPDAIAAITRYVRELQVANGIE